MDVSGVQEQSLALCIFWHVMHTCRYVQLLRKTHVPRFMTCRCIWWDILQGQKCGPWSSGTAAHTELACVPPLYTACRRQRCALCHGRVSSTPVGLETTCSTARTGLSRPVGRMPCHSPTSRCPHGIRPLVQQGAHTPAGHV